MGKVLVSSQLAGAALDRLRALHDVEVGEDPVGLGRERIAARIADKDALVSLLGDRIDAKVIDAAPRLRIVANYAVGFDNIDLDACRARGIVVTNTPGVLTEATADLTWALLLAAARRVCESDRIARSGRWRGWGPTEMLGVRVSGSTLGLVGFGRIGQAVARRARGFGMRVLYTQRTRLPADRERELDATFVPLDALLATSDVVSLHCPLTEATRGVLSRERIFAMKRGAIVVNTARGACVDELALAEAVRSGHLAGAGLDVFAHEPTIPKELAAEDRVVLTTHVGSADEPTRAEMASLCVDAVVAVLERREPPNRVV